MLEKKIFDVQGMHCASCANNVEKAIKPLETVRSATVNLINNTLKVCFDAEKLNPEIIIEAVEKLGFKCKLRSNDSDWKRREEEVKKDFIKKRNNAIISLVLTAILMTISMTSMKITFLPPPFKFNNSTAFNFGCFLFL